MYQLDTNCKLQAHRGVCTDAPENTMAAFRAAVAEGYDIIEFDPKFTADNIAVVLHDFTLNRTGRVAGKPLGEEKLDIRQTNFSALADIDVGEWFDPRFAGERVPTLSQALAFMRAAEIEAKIDNVWQTFTPEQQEILFDLIERHGGKVGVTCTELSLLERFAARFPRAPLHFDGDITPEALDALSVIGKGHPVTVWAHMGTKLVSWCTRPAITAEVAAAIKAHGFSLGIWILTDDEEMKAALALGADVVETTGSIKPRRD